MHDGNNWCADILTLSPIKYYLQYFSQSSSGWVVTWFLLGYTAQMFEYTVRIFWSKVSRFLYVFSSIPRKLYTVTLFSSPHFSQSNTTKISSLSFLLWVKTLSQRKLLSFVQFISIIQARSFPLKILWQDSVLKVRSLMRISWHL